MWNDLDMINVMTYDYHGFWDGKTGHHSPLYAVGKTDEDGGEFEYYNTVSATNSNMIFPNTMIFTCGGQLAGL